MKEPSQHEHHHRTPNYESSNPHRSRHPGAEPRNDLIAYGGARFDQGLSRLGLVDEYRLMIQPAALGAGLPLFRDLPGPLHLELVEATTYKRASPFTSTGRARLPPTSWSILTSPNMGDQGPSGARTGSG
jgi:dihydrofolate reductase